MITVTTLQPALLYYSQQTSSAMWAVVQLANNNTAYSSDGLHWSSSQLPPGNNLTASATQMSWGLTYGQGKFVALSVDGTSSYSINGINWSSMSYVQTSSSLYCVMASSPTMFAALNYGNAQSFYSSDGIHWSSSIIAGSSWLSMAYGNGIFVAIGIGAYSATSNDGINWTVHNIATSYTASSYEYICYGNGKFVAVGVGNGDSSSIYSTDGVTWSDGNLSQNMMGANSAPEAVAYGEGLFTMLGSGKSASYSTDGIHWNYIPLVGNLGTTGYQWYSMWYKNGLFVAVGYATNNIFAYSTDGMNWNTGSIPINDSWAVMSN